MGVAVGNDKIGRASNGMNDEEYVLGLCNRILGTTGPRQHRFEWLQGDKGHHLPVDAYYENLKFVIEYRERQHDSPGPRHWNRPTASGLPRDEQRKEVRPPARCRESSAWLSVGGDQACPARVGLPWTAHTEGRKR